MSAWHRRGWWPRLFAVALVAGLGALGCGKKAGPAPSEAEDKPAAATEVERQAEPKADAPVSKPAASPAAPAKVVRDRLHQSFADAAFDNENPPAGPDGSPSVEKPVDRTVTGKSAPELYAKVVETWDTVRFTAPDGKRIDYVVEMNTSMGIIKMAVLPELAPNHARNFLVLAKLGYYDGLRFDRIHRDPFEDGVLHCLEAGCPLGTAEAGTGSIGYWMKNENTSGEQCSHTEGVVGAYREVESNGAATMFYVNLNKAPFRDGHYSIFAKIIEGLDVVRKMSTVATVQDPSGGKRDRPATPIIIHKATIQEMIAEDDKN
jgi:cyclophilin family peptidyl-prolyl cis-trans isomerase